jgi:uncharacterized iron-regulated membrane protein
MRSTLLLLHRWFGLSAALFLFIAGLTGAIISWDHELDEWLNPQLYRSSTQGVALPAVELAARVERADPRVRVTSLPLSTEAGHALLMFVSPRIDPETKQPYPLTYNQVAVDPVSGEVQAHRGWGAVSLSKENLLPFLYKLHYSMHIPDGWNVEWGVWLMGLIGIGWVFDCFVGLWLVFPSRKGWKKSFAFRWRDGGTRLNFDLHRSGSAWVWLLLLLLAITSVSMNLNSEVMRPLVSFFSPLSPSPFADRKPIAPEQMVEPRLHLAEILALAKAEAARRHWQTIAGSMFYSPEVSTYGVGFSRSGDDHGDAGLGNAWLYLDADSGHVIGAAVPGEGSAGDVFMQAQFPLHSGRILGLTGRILISLMGVIVAMLSATGVVIWMHRRRARQRNRPAEKVATLHMPDGPVTLRR